MEPRLPCSVARVDSALPRVLFVSKPIAPPWHDGSKNLVRDVASHLERTRATVLSTPEFARRSTLGERVDVEPLYEAPGRFAPPMMANARVLARLLRGDPLDLWHFVFAPNAASSFAAVFAKKGRRMLGFRGPVVQTVASAPRSFEGVGRLLFGDVVIALSEWTRGRLVGSGVTGVPIHVIPPCAQAPERPDEARVRALREAHKLVGKVVVYPGDYEFSRGAKSFLEALPELARHLGAQEATFVFACRAKTPRAAEAEAEIRARVVALGLAPRVRYLGEVKDMPALLASASVVAFPVDDLYGKVDVPLVLLEALALGVPMVVATGGPLEALLPAAVGVSPGDEDELGAAILRLLSDEGERRSRAEEGARMYASRFTPDVVAKAHDALYAEALASGRGTRS